MTLLTSTNRTNLRIGKRPGQQFLAVRVHDIILGSYHERWEEFGGWDSLGTIFYVNPKSPSSVNQQNKIYPHARPLFSYSKNYPLVGEMVLVMHSLAKDIVSSGNVGHKMKYYLPAINVWNHPHHNSLPQNIEVPDTDSNSISLSGFKKASNGLVVRQPQEGSTTDIPLGEYFKEKINAKPLMPYEGDLIFESRFGSSLRFGSTSPYDKTLNESQPYPNGWSYESLHGAPTYGSKTGSIGDPVVILRCGQSPFLNPIEKGWVPGVEEINEDDSCIWMTSNHVISTLNVAGARSASPETVEQNSYMSAEPYTLGDQINTAVDDIEGVVDVVKETYDTAVNEGIMEVIAPTQPVIEQQITQSYDDGINDFSFYDEMIDSGVMTDDDFEQYEIEFEDTTVSGTDTGTTDFERAVFETPESTNNTTSTNTSGNTSSGGGYSSKSELSFQPHGDYWGKWETNKLYWQAIGGKKKRTLLDAIGYYADDGKPKYPITLHGKGGVLTTITKPRTWGEVKATLGPKAENKTHLMIHTTAGNSVRMPITTVGGQLYSERGCKALGGSRGGYHIMVQKDGMVTQVYPDAFTAYGAGGWNGNKGRSSIHINWMGGAQNKKIGDWSSSHIISKAQVAVLNKIVLYYVERYPNIKLVGHNQANSKPCPWWNVSEYAKALGIGDANIEFPDGGGKNTDMQKEYARERGRQIARGMFGEQLAKKS